MAQLNRPVEPFGEVNVYKQAGGGVEVAATILMVPDIEGARTGLALDASASMRQLYGVSGLVSSVFASATPNVMEPVARTMASFLAKFSANGKVNLIYWACSPDGSDIEEIGELADADIQKIPISGPKKKPWGRGTKLLPPVKYYLDQALKDAPWSVNVFVTDGIIEDLEAVKTYCVAFAKELSAGKRHPTKLVLIGVGNEVDEGQMEELDDMFEGNEIKDSKGDPIDLWDHKMASEMRQLEEIFAEVVSERIIVAPSGRIVDNTGRVAKEYADGLPAALRFTLPAGATAFTLEFAGGKITQDISEGLARI